MCNEAIEEDLYNLYNLTALQPNKCVTKLLKKKLSCWNLFPSTLTPNRGVTKQYVKARTR